MNGKKNRIFLVDTQIKNLNSLIGFKFFYTIKGIIDENNWYYIVEVDNLGLK
ncbi:MAG: hypothetical protein K0R07_857 [Sedimentibacter sp.]|nr:hypothetical protein [Sedimentibacter sp.]